MRPAFDAAGLPEHHEGLLLVQTRPGFAPDAQAMRTGLAMAVGAQPEFAGPGMSALGFYERAGLIKRVIAVTAPRQMRDARAAAEAAFAAPFGLGAAALAMAEAAAPAAAPNAPGLAGLTLIELSKEKERENLQLALAQDPNVLSVSRVPIRYLCARRAAAAAAPTTEMWNLSKIGWRQARELPGYKDADDVDVAVLDTGFDSAHPDLAGRLKQYVYDHPDTPSASSPQDIIGHGTHVSGTISALINNGLGVNGICSAKISAWKIFDDIPTFVPQWQEFTYFVDPVMYLRALIDCVVAKPQVVNLSIGGPGAPDAAEAEAFRQIIANETVVVAAMGNGRQQGSLTSYPAAIPGVIAVGATSIDDRVANFSNRGAHISVCAPGEAIWSTLPTYAGQSGFTAVPSNDGSWRQGQPKRRETNYDAWPGTSMATPHVTAAVALYLANGGVRTVTGVRKALIETVDKTPLMAGADFHPDYGFGRLNLAALVKRAQAGR